MSFKNWLFGGIVGLAIIGLGFLLFKNPMFLVMQLLLMGLGVLVIFFVFRWIMGRGKNYKEQASYAKAVKFSKKRYQRNTTNNRSTLNRKKALRSKSTAHLTVIEGKKNKKKDRAIF